MKSQKSRDDGFHERGERIAHGSGDSDKKKKWQVKKNIKRLGGGGLSLEAFANAKSKNNAYNPALLKKKREFYKNAKHVGKYKKMLKQQGQANNPSSSVQPTEENDSRDASLMNKNNKKGKEAYSLELLYEKKREEEEKARMEREAIIKAKREERESAEARRKEIRKMMYKKTRKGQPVMKYRIEHILKTLQGSKS